MNLRTKHHTSQYHNPKEIWRSTFTILCTKHSCIFGIISVQNTSRLQQRIGDLVAVAEKLYNNISTLNKINENK